MATTDIGRVTPIWRGFYSAATTYELNDIVIDTAGSVWWHKSPAQTTGEIPEAGEIWDAVIDMSIFSGLIQAAITTAQTALEAAREAVGEVSADTERAETAAQNAETSALNAAESAASVGAQAQAAERSAEAAAGSATGAAGSAQAAAGSKSDAEAYAVGKRGGEDVGSTDPTFHNNAKYYSEQAESSADAAVQSAEAAQDVLDSIPADYSTLSGEVGNLKESIDEAVDSEDVWDSITLSVQTDGYYKPDGDFHPDTARRYAIVDNVSAGEKYRVCTILGPALIPAILYYNESTFISYEKTGTGSIEIVTDYEFTIPAGCDKIIVQCARPTGDFTLEKYTGQNNVFRAYTKQESDARYTPISDYNDLESEVDIIDSKVDNLTQKKYGVRWNINDPDDLGMRIFDAAGKTATIGVGATNGASDFDSIYPWSEIKRCNIKKNAAGASIITFEGETGFALDGTNGDVFVRIPKFCAERYTETENGTEYEYCVISVDGGNVHPAFVENGKTLNEIFVGAFEAFIDNGELSSKAGVIPTNCVVADDFLDAARANGGNYSLYDSRCVDAVWCLMAVEFGTRNTNQVFGFGCSGYEYPATGNQNRHNITGPFNVPTNSIKTSPWTVSNKTHMPVGSNITICQGNAFTVIAQATITACTDGDGYTEWTFDGDGVTLDSESTYFIGSAPCFTNFCETVPSGALNWHTGRAAWIAGNENKMNPVRYRWMENLVGNVWAFLPDISFYNLQMFICRDMTEYEFGKITVPYYPVGATLPENTNNGSKEDNPNVEPQTNRNFWITKLFYDYFTPNVPFGSDYDRDIVHTQAFGAYYYLKQYDGNTLKPFFISNGGGFDHLYRCNVLTNRAWQTVTTKAVIYGARMMYKHIS